MHPRAIADITEFIFMHDEPQFSDIIFIPGTSQSAIIEKAAELYLAGLAPYVLPSGRYSPNVGRFAREKIDNPKYDGAFPTDYAYCKHILLENGVPAQAILKEDRAMQSMENAAFSAQVLHDQGITPTRAILCCQAFHARRSFLSYSKYFPETEILVIPVSTQDIRREDWFMSEKSYQKVMSEVAKCGRYFMDFE